MACHRLVRVVIIPAPRVIVMMFIFMSVFFFLRRCSLRGIILDRIEGLGGRCIFVTVVMAGFAVSVSTIRIVVVA